MRIGKERVFVLFALTCLTVSAMLSNIKASDTSSTTISVEPPTITVPVSTNFTVNINIKNVTRLCAWQARLRWNSSLLDFVDASEGAFFTTGHMTGSATNQSEGWTFPFNYIMPPTPGVNGTGTLANIEFNCTGVGECILALNDTKLIDSSAVSVPTPPYLGDADGDLWVGPNDVILVAMAYYSRIGDPNYNANADFDSDGFVDLFDYMCVYFNYMFMYPGNALKPVEITHEVHDGYVINVLRSVGGVWIPVDKLGLLAPYIASVSTILVATAATAIYVKHVKRRKKKQ